MQKIDKIAIAAVGLILVLGIVLSLTGDDPGKKYTREIEEYAETISDTMGDQSRLRAGDPVAFGEELEALFDLGSGESFPEWAFHRRPTHYSVEKFIPKTPPVHENGGICKVEVLREAPQRLYHRITGVGASCNEVVEIGRQVVEVAPMGAYGPGDWVEVATIPFSGNGESFTLELDTGLEPGCCDAVLLRLVYHHFQEPAPMRADLRAALKPAGVIAVIDILPQQGWRELPGVPDRGGHGIPPDRLLEEMTGDGFELVARFDDWNGDEDRFCMVFLRQQS